MNELSVVVPEEPWRRSVVLDREGSAWQSNGREWQRAGVRLTFGPSQDVKSWALLIVENGPLALLHDAASGFEGWREAGFTDPGCTSFTEPSPAEAPTDGSRDAGFDAPDCRRFAQAAS